MFKVMYECENLFSHFSHRRIPVLGFNPQSTTCIHKRRTIAPNTDQFSPTYGKGEKEKNACEAPNTFIKQCLEQKGEINVLQKLKFYAATVHSIST